MLQNILNLPVLFFGDFNIHITDMIDSGLLAAHNLNIIEMPGDPSTKNGKRQITYIVHSGNLNSIIHNIHKVTEVPFGPHFGHTCKIQGNSAVIGTRLHVPRPLPRALFNLEYQNLTPEYINNHMQTAEEKAKVTLSRQREKTGFAILGTPPPHILVDKKTQGTIFNNSKQAGETLALKALAIEYFILDIAKIQGDERRKYIGRSQFPKFSIEALPERGIPEFITREDLISKVGIIRNIIYQICTQENTKPTHIKYLNRFAKYISTHIFTHDTDCTFAEKPVHQYLQDEDWVFLHTALTSIKPKLSLIRNDTDSILSKLTRYLTQEAAHASMRQWAAYVKACISKGGSKLFDYISKEDKLYLSVLTDTAGTYRHSPNAFLEQQAQFWEQKWHKATKHLNEDIKALLLTILQKASDDITTYRSFLTQDLEQGLYGYPKDTKGIDNWTATELRGLPKEAKDAISYAINQTYQLTAQPIQNLINLNPILGKPSSGTRTICKTPMLYRISLRARKEVADWEHYMTADFDTSGKGKSALVAAAYRGLEAEVYKYTEEQVIGVCHDFDKFFDSIDIPVLLNKAIDVNFPTSL